MDLVKRTIEIIQSNVSWIWLSALCLASAAQSGGWMVAVMVIGIALGVLAYEKNHNYERQMNNMFITVIKDADKRLEKAFGDEDTDK